MKNKLFILLAVAGCIVMSNFCMGFKIAPSKNDDAGFCGGGNFTEESESIAYATKNTTEYKIKSEVPSYYGQIDSTNCANVAGAVLIGYYDRFCEELIPNYKTYIQIGSVIKYRAASTETESVINSLHDYMGTDVGIAGTTYSGFQKGMRTYVNNHNYTYNITEFGGFDFERYKTAVEGDIPVALFLLDYSLIVTGQDSGTLETINSHHFTRAHVVVGYGYKIDTYYNSNNQIITTRTYLKVASGFVEYGMRYLCLDGKSNIENATAVIIS